MYDEQVQIYAYSTDGMTPSVTVVYNCIAALTYDLEKRDDQPDIVLDQMQAVLLITAFCFAVMCLQGSRSSFHKYNLQLVDHA